MAGFYTVTGDATERYVAVHQTQAQNQTDRFSPYSKIRADHNNDDTLDYRGEAVSITGVANIATGLLHEHYLQAFVQNDSAGMSIFADQIDTPFSVGDSIVAHGRIQRYSGLAEVKVDSYQVYPKEGRLPASEAVEKGDCPSQKILGNAGEGQWQSY
ncbi:MAG: hypothetical protein U5J63_09010 [Fodinibius sp.]|nr:hypothetical protein [Fodinibius sp.]